MQRFEMSIWEKDDGDFVYFHDYAALEAENAKLKKALRECVHQIKCVEEHYPIHPIDLPKLYCALRQAREVLGDA
jgi:hypothetical protein